MSKKTITILLISVVLSIFITLLFPGKPKHLLILELVSSVMLIFYFHSILKLFSFSLRYFPRQRHRFKHLFIIIPVSFILTFGLLWCWKYIWQSILDLDKNFTIDLLLEISLILSILIVTCLEGIDFFKYWKTYIIHSEQVEKANLLAQYETLRNQVNPHFLLNGLNTLISFIENNDKRAAEFAQNMSDFLKYLLTIHKEKLITLKHELSVVNQYIFLQNARFDENLVVTIKTDEKSNNYYLPPLTLQILVENAIKHNKISSSKKLYIDIYESDGYMFVKNNKQPKEDVGSTKVGISNIKGRYGLFTSHEVIIEETNQNFIIGVPLLNNQTYEPTDN